MSEQTKRTYSTRRSQCIIWRSRTVGSRTNVTHGQSATVSSALDTNCKLVIGFPSTSKDDHINIEEIVEFLKLQGLPKAEIVRLQEDENFLQYTLQFPNNDGR